MPSSVLAKHLGITPAAMSKGLKRARRTGEYRGAPLQIIEFSGRGRGGNCYAVKKSTIPASWLKSTSAAVESPGAPVAESTDGRALVLAAESAPDVASMGRKFEDQLTDWKISLVKLVRAETTERDLDEVIAAVASRSTWPAGPKKGKPLSAGTLKSWIYKAQRDSLYALGRKERSDNGAKRVYASLEIDAALKAIGTPVESLRALGDHIKQLVLSHWDAGPAGWKEVRDAVSFDLIPELRKLGLSGTDQELCELATLPRRTIRAGEHEGRFSNDFVNDKAKIAAKVTPRIFRDRIFADGRTILPGELLAMDVTPLDVVLRREDGTLATPRMISFTCVATNRIAYTLELFDKGRSVRQSNVGLAFAEVLCNPAFGVPLIVYMDHGAEYAALNTPFVKDLFALRGKIRIGDISEIDERKFKRTGVIQSEPHNPQSKFIETLFGIIEKKLKKIPGYIGSDRTRKKTQNQGHAPAPFPGTFEEFKTEFAKVIEYYHTTDQSGALGNLSPNKKFNELVSAHGWRAVPIDSWEIAFAFVRPIERTLDRGTFDLKLPHQPKYTTTTWTSDALHRMPPNTKVNVRLSPNPVEEIAYVFRVDDKGRETFETVAVPVTRFAVNDPAGAKEQRRLKKLMDDYAAAIKSRCIAVAQNNSLFGHSRLQEQPDIPAPHPAISVAAQFNTTALARKPVIDQQPARDPDAIAHENAELDAVILSLRRAINHDD